MQTNDIFRRLRYALNLKDSQMLKLFKEAGFETDQATLLNF